ncbi:MAG: class I SAM-dependent methyltransferase [Candidatus Promineifilaceae bacterium]
MKRKIKSLFGQNNSELSALNERWEIRAKRNPMHYIYSTQEDWNLDEFLQTGEENIAAIVDKYVALYQIDPSELVAVDIGCGMGRLTQALAHRFKHVHGFDISESMIASAKSIVPDSVDNIDYYVTSGSSLQPLGTEAIDFVFSYIVLQHVPSKEIVRQYLYETARILKPNGHALLQVNGRIRPLRERIHLKVVASDRMPILKRRLKFKIDPPSSMGATFTLAEIEKLAAEVDLKLLAIRNPGSNYMWLELQKAEKYPMLKYV